MQRELPRTGRGPAAFTFDSKLENEQEVLDALLSALARGQLPPDTWSKFHLAAVRDDRLAEVAFAYESAAQGKRVKTMPPASVAEFFYRASTFFSDAFGDELGAVSYLERALAASPTHPEAFAKIEELLTKSSSWRKLADIFVSNAPHHPRADQAGRLRRAAELYEQDGAEDKVVELYQQILRLDPHDDATRERLEARYIKANRHRDVARLLEQALTTDPPPSDATSIRARSRLVEMYSGQLHEPERSMPHIEAILEKDPTHEESRRVATKLLEVKGLAGRAAAALAGAHARAGVPSDVAKFLAIELEYTRGPKRKDVLRKVGVLRQERLNDAAGAFEAFEAALALDSTDDELRGRYAQLAGKLGKELDAARAMSRVGAAHKDPVLRAKLTSEVGKLFLAGGDAKRAKTAFVSVLAMPDLTPVASLEAARALCAIYASEGDHVALADGLERVAMAEPDPELRQIANEELAELATSTLKDARRAIGAWRRLVGTSVHTRALEILERLYEETGDGAELAWVLAERAKDAVDPKEARRIAFRAAEVLTANGADPARASEAWRNVIAIHGPARDVHARWIPILEAQRQWGDLAAVLESEVELSPDDEKAALFVRTGALKLQRTRDVAGAIESFRRALEVDPHERTSRTSLEKLLGLGDHRLEAAAVLEPIYRAEGATAGLLRILDIRAQLAKDPDARLLALEEALRVAEQGGGGGDRTRAIDLVARGLAEAVASDRPQQGWLERLDRFAPPGSEPKRRAAVLTRALGSRPVDSASLLDLAKRTAEALAAGGEAAAAVEIYRRALAFEPTSTELLTRVDDLLRDQGDPRERIALYQAALERNPPPPRRRDLLHKIGAIQRTDVGDAPAAIETFRAALQDDPADQDAHTALSELYAATLQWPQLCDLLERQLATAAVAQGRKLRIAIAEVAAAHGEGPRAIEHLRALLEGGSLQPDELSFVEKTAETLGEVELQRESLRGRISAADDPRDQLTWLDKLARLELSRNESESAVSLWKRAAQISEKAGDDEQARRFYEKAREVAPEDGETALRLSDLLERAGEWAALPGLYAVLLEATELPRARVGILMRHARVLADHLDDPAGALVSVAQAFELTGEVAERGEVLTVFTQLALRGRGTHIFAQAMDDAIAKLAGETPEFAAQRADLSMAKARVMAANREGRASAAGAYRTVLDDPLVDDSRLKAALLGFEALLGAAFGQAQTPEAAEQRRADRRWLLSWKAKHAPEGGLVQALVAWATAEEGFGDTARALELYRQAQALDPESADVLGGVSRLALVTGDVPGAIAALTARRDRSAGAARAALDLEVATILIERTDRPEDALDALASVLLGSPQEEVALGLVARLLPMPGAHTRAVAVLERACEAIDDLDTRAQILRYLLETQSDPPDAREVRQRWYERLLDLRREQGNLDLALHTAVAAASELPTVDPLWDRAEELARELRRPNEVGELYQEALSRPLPRESALSLGQRAVSFHEEWFEDSAGVVRILERVLEIDPSASWAFDRLKLIFDAAERWDELFVLYDRAIGAADAASRVALLEDAAQIAKDFANNSDRAIGYLEQLLVHKPGNGRLVAALERLYERNGSHRELITLLSAQLASQEEADAQRARARIALLWLDEIGDSASALVVIEEILQHPDRAGVEVFELLEKVLASAPPHAEVRDSILPPPESGQGRRRDSVAPGAKRRVPVRQRAAGLLRELYTDAGREADLVRILEVELESITNVKERIRRHNQIASLHMKLGNDAAATDHLASLVMLEPEVVSHRATLGELAAKIGRYDRLAEVLAAAADECDTGELRVELLVNAAEVQAEHLRDPGKAIDLLLRVLALPSIAATSALAAARRAEPLLEASGRSWERLDVLERVAELEPDRNARLLARTAAAHLATELGENSRAILAWEARLEDGGGSLAEALDGLVALLEREKRWARLTEVLDRRARTERSPEARRSDRVQIARVEGEELGDVPLAIDAWRTVEKEFGENDETMDALAALFARVERWSELASLLERGAARAQSGERRAELLRLLGDLQGERLGAFDRALANFEAALSADARNPGARAGLRAMLDAPAWRGPAVGILLRALVATGEWRGVLELTEHRLATAADSPARVAILREVARIAEDRTADSTQAFHSIRKALLEHPADAELEAELARLAEATDEWQAYADAYRQIVEQAEALAGDRPSATPGGSWIARRRQTLGETLEKKLDSPARALECFFRAAQDAPTDASIALGVIRVVGVTGRWDAAATVIVAFARATSASCSQLLDAVEAAAHGPSAWDGATTALASAVATASDLPAPIPRDLEARIGAWHRDKRGDPEAAEAAFARALTYDSLNADLLSALAQIQRRAKGRPLIDSLLRLSQATGGDLELLREAAEIAIESVTDRALAKSILESLLRLAKERWLGESTPSNPSAGNPAGLGPLVRWAQGHLVRIHDEEGSTERTVDLLVDTARLPFPRDVSRGMLHEAARLTRAKLGNKDRAIQLYAGLFDEHAGDAEAVRALVELYEEEHRTLDLLALRVRQIAHASSVPERLALRLAAASLQTSLGSVEGCLSVLRDSLAEAPRDAETTAALFQVLSKNDRFGELAAALAVQAELAERDKDPTVAADFWEKAASVSELQQGDARAAIGHHRRVVALEPRPNSLDALARLLSSHGDHASAAQYLDRLHAQARGSDKGPIILRLADALAASGRADLARARLEEALSAEPAAEAIRSRLAQSYREALAWEPLAELLAAGADHAPDKGTRLGRLVQAADLYTATCKKPELGIPLLEQAADLDPENRAIKLSLADALGAAGRFADARTLLRALVESFGGRRPKERAPVHYYLARLELKMGDRARSLVELDAATRIDPANPQILRALAELARDDGQLERAERSYRALLVALKRPEEAEESAPMVRSEVLLELSLIAERQGEAERAGEVLESALETATKGEIEAARFERALREKGRHDTLVRALKGRLARAGVAPAALPILSQLAEVLDVELGHLADAFDVRMRAVALQPASPQVHEAALGLARRVDGIGRYVEEVERLAAAAEEKKDRDLVGALLVRLGRVVEDELHDDDRAARLYERARALDLRDAGAVTLLRALDRVYERTGNRDAQAKVLSARMEAEAASGDAEAAADATYRLAALYLASDAMLDEGCDRLEAAIATGDVPDRAVTILKTAAAAHPTKARVVELYERVARSPGRERALVDALTRKATAPDAGLSPLAEAVEIAKGIGDGALEEGLLRRYVARAQELGDGGGIGWALDLLSDLREGAGDVTEAIDLKRRAVEISEPDVARRLRFEIAHLAADALGDLEIAARTYEELLEGDPADRDAWVPLLEVYRRARRHDKLLALLAKVVDFVDDMHERSRIRLERVRVLMDDQAMGDEALAPLREIVDEDPSHVEAAILLAGILERTGQTDALGDLLAKQIDSAKDRSDAAAVGSLSLRLARLLEKKSPPDAKAALYGALEWEPKNVVLLEALSLLHERDGESGDRADVLERMLALQTGDAAEKTALHLHAQRTELGDAEAAERALELGFKVSSKSSLGDRLEKAYRDRGAWDKLAELFAVGAHAEEDLTRRVLRLREAASLYKEQVGEPARAVELLRAARAALPEDRALLGELVDTLAETGELSAAVAELSDAIDRPVSTRRDESAARASGDATLAPLFARRSDLKVKMGLLEEALTDQDLAFMVGGEPFAGDLVAQLTRLRQNAAVGGDVAHERVYVMRLAEVLPEIGRADEARSLLSELVKQNAKDRDALRALGELEEKAQHWEAVSATYRRLVPLEEGEAVVTTALKLADACDRAGGSADARGALERARLVAPQNDALRARLTAIYEREGAYRELAEMNLEDAKGAKDVAGRFTFLLRAGSLLLAQGDSEAAATALAEAHALRASDAECTVLLADAHTLAGRFAEAVELINQAIASHKGKRSRELGALYHRLARVSHHAGDQASELAWLVSALDMDGQSGFVASELATVAMGLGQMEVASRALRTITMLKPPVSSPITKALAYQYLAEMARQQGDVKRAVMLLKRAVDEDPELDSAKTLLESLQE